MLVAMRALARLDRSTLGPSCERVNLVELLEDAIDGQQVRAAHSHHHLRLCAPEGEPLSVQGDAALLRIAVANLIDNGAVGLAIVRRIAELHRGTVSLSAGHDHDAGGCTVTLTESCVAARSAM